MYLCTNKAKNMTNHHKVNDSNFASLNFVACIVDQFHAKLEGALYRGKIIFLFLNKKFLFVKPSIILALPAVSLLCWENFRFKAIITPRSLTHCMLSSFTLLISYSYFWFLVPT